MKKINQVIDQLKEQGAILARFTESSDIKVYIFTLKGENIVVLDHGFVAEVYDKRKEEPIKTDFTKEHKAQHDFSILKTAVEHYFEPVLEMDLQHETKKQVIQSKNNLIERIKNKFI